MNGLIHTVTQSLIETVATAVLNTGVNEWDYHGTTEYRRGWLDGYAQCYRKLTGETIYQFVDKVNAMIDGSGHKISM